VEYDPLRGPDDPNQLRLPDEVSWRLAVDGSDTVLACVL